MLLIASSGRCGTLAICNGLSQYSDHLVMHEPEPRLLEEAYNKHNHKEFQTYTFKKRLDGFSDRIGQKYGESFRAPNLLNDIYKYVPDMKILVVVRDPLEYILSAHSKKVFQKDDMWERTRLIPIDFSSDFQNLTLAEKLCWHWVIVNRYLIDFADKNKKSVKLIILRDLRKQIIEISDSLGIRITDPHGLDGYLSSKPNSSEIKEIPDGFDPDHLKNIFTKEWQRACELSRA